MAPKGDWLRCQETIRKVLLMTGKDALVYAKEALGVGDTGYGVLLACWGVGMVLGSVVFATVGEYARDRDIGLGCQLAEDEGFFLQAGAGPELLRPLRLEHEVVVAHVGACLAAALVDERHLPRRSGVAPGELEDPDVGQDRVGSIGLGVRVGDDDHSASG
jgi:hypothetical protein